MGRTMTMGRLIDRDRLCNDLMERWSLADKRKEDLIRAVMADVVTPIVVSQPTVDAVPVVRCKDCKHNPKLEWFGCPMASLSEKQRPETAWCWRGERKDGDGNG